VTSSTAALAIQNVATSHKQKGTTGCEGPSQGKNRESLSLRENRGSGLIPKLSILGEKRMEEDS